MAKRTIAELKQLQALPLEVKVKKTELRIKEWVEAFGLDGVYVSFSGGKDSTVLLTICRNLYPDIKAVFVDTGLEYPEIRDFVRTWDNVEWIKPKMNFKKVIETYGYPFISKQVSKRCQEWRNAIEKGKDITKTEAYKEFNGESYFIREGYSEPAKSFHNKEKWAFLVESPYKFSNKCCDFIKKKTLKAMGDSKAITGQMAEESINREKSWLLHGCNAFEASTPISNPLSFWTEQDILHYAKKNSIKIASCYGSIVYEDADGLQYDEPLFADDMKLTTTGCKRTGCMFCGYGCHLEKPNEGRFEQMKKTHPKQYEYIMKPWSDGGLDYKNVIDWINEHGNLNIRY